MSNQVPVTWREIFKDLCLRVVCYLVPVWVAALAVITALLALVAGPTEPGRSFVDFVSMPSRYWILVAGLLGALFIRRYVIYGVTRMNAIVAGLLTSLVTAVGLALILALGYLLEHGILSSQGWLLKLSMKHSFDNGSQFIAVWAEMSTVYLMHILAGAVIGLLFLAYEQVKATILSVSVYLGVVAGEAFIPSGWPGAAFGEALTSGQIPVAVAPAIVTVAVATPAALLWGLGRVVPAT